MRFKVVTISCLLFLLSVAAWAGSPTYTVLYQFQGAPNDGAFPYDLGAGLARDASGNLFGTTNSGGGWGQNGTVFELSGTTETVLYSFSPYYGSSVNGNVVLDSLGNIYGTATGGGECCGNGTIWELSSGIPSLLWEFDGGDGWGPTAGPVWDSKGNLYGTTPFGGEYGAGVVWEYTSGASNVLYNFTGGSDGAKPYAGLAMDGEGNLYGTTYEGGNGNGVVFELSNSGGVWTETVLYSFPLSGEDGALPQASLTLAGKPLGSIIYGVTSADGAPGAAGTVFKMTKSKKGYKLTTIHSFSGGPNDGEIPVGTLLLYKGKLYGTTWAGGTYGYGTVFELALESGAWTETILYNFTDGADGAAPAAGLIADSKGNLYGATTAGGYFNSNNGCGAGCGVIFEIIR